MAEQLRKAGVSAMALFIAAMLSVCLIPNTRAYAEDVNESNVTIQVQDESCEASSESAENVAEDGAVATVDSSNGNQSDKTDKDTAQNATIQLAQSAIPLTRAEGGWTSDAIVLDGVMGTLALVDGQDDFVLQDSEGAVVEQVDAGAAFCILYTGEYFEGEQELAFTLTGNNGAQTATLSATLATIDEAASSNDVDGSDEANAASTADEETVAQTASGASSKSAKSSKSSASGVSKSKSSSNKSSSSKSSGSKGAKSSSSSRSGSSSKHSTKSSGDSQDTDVASTSSSRSRESSIAKANGELGTLEADVQQEPVNENAESESPETAPTAPAIAISTLALLGAAGVANAARFK